MQTMETRLLVKPAMNVETPMETIFFTRRFSSRSVEFRRRRIACSPVRKRNTQTADINWEMIVARAAPCTPIWNAKIKMGSKIRFATAPKSTVSMPIRAKP